jgi:hypothetical protein
MTIMKKLVIIGLLIALVVAGIYFVLKKEPVPPKMPPSLLETMARKAHLDCALVGTGSPDVPGYPVPLGPKSNGLLKTDKAFRSFFYSIYPSYPAQAPDKRPEVITVDILVEFDLQGSSTCLPMTDVESGSHGPRYSPEADRLSVSEVILKQSELYSATQRIADAYWSQVDDETNKTLAKDFVDKFIFISEPGLRKQYYELNPDFWGWLEQLTGRNVFGEYIIK